MSKDKGAFIQGGYTVEPGEDGSFVVTEGGHRFGNSPDGQWRIRAWRGFTNWSDLVAWLSVEHASNATKDQGGSKG
jgi:hypothetical protein